MAITTVACTANFHEDDGTPLVGAIVTATLDRVDYDANSRSIAPLSVSGTTDANGDVSLSLWPNVLGTKSSKYRFTCYHPTTGDTLINGLATVPNAASNIITILGVTTGTVPVPPDWGTAADISYIQAGTGATTRTVQNRLRDLVSVKDFGAVGNGITDETTDINEAEAGLNGTAGGILLVPVGTYLHSGWTPTQADMVVQGEGNRTSVIKGTGAGSAAIAFSGLARTHWRDLRIDGGEVKTAAMTMLGSSGVNLFTNVRFGGGTTNTIAIGTAGGSGDDIANCLWVGCTIQSDTCSGAQLKLRGNNVGSNAMIGGRISTGNSAGAGIKAIDIDDGSSMRFFMTEVLGSAVTGTYVMEAASGTLMMYGGHCEGAGLVHTLSTDARTDFTTSPHVFDGVSLATNAGETTIYHESPRTMIVRNTCSAGNARVGASGRLVLENVKFATGASPVIDAGGELVAHDLPKGTYAVAAAGYLEDAIVHSISTPANVSGLWLFNEDGSTTTVTDRGTLAHNLTLTKAANLLSQKSRGYASSLLFGNSNADYFTTADHADFTFGNGATDSAFSIAVMIKPTTMANVTLLSKYNASSGAGEWHFHIGGDSKLNVLLRDASAAAQIGRSYNTALADTALPHVYVMTYSGSGASTGLKLYRDGVQVDDTNQNDGVYTAMEDTTLVVANYVLAPGVLVGNERRYATAVFKEELTSAKVKRLSRLLLAYAGVA